MAQNDIGEFVHHLVITAELDRHAAEALHLELRRLARRYGVEIKDFRVEKVTEEIAGPGQEDTAR